ncbi:MAG: single-stranded DNA-binding protein [Sphaerochaetaceae bacterium]|nr:single-stranded DNA-binding protein [Sphaerochaetaceae bacterium]
MNDLNTILIEGRLVRDPEFKEIQERGTFVTRFSIATARFYYDKNKNWVQDTSFFQVEVWGQAAIVCDQILKKGRTVRIVGRIKQTRWKDREERNRERICIVAEHIEFKPEKRSDSAPVEQPTRMDSAMTERMREDARRSEDENLTASEEPISEDNTLTTEEEPLAEEGQEETQVDFE